MIPERALDLDRGDPEAADFDHVVRAALVPVEAVLVHPVPITGEEPLALHGLLGLLVVAPVVRRGGITLDREISRLAWLHGISSLVQYLGLITRHGLAAGAGFDLFGRVGDEDVQHLRRADTVENDRAEHLFPAPPYACWQRLRRRDAQANGGEVVFAGSVAVEHRVVERWHREEQGRFELLGGAKDSVWHGLAGEEHRRSSGPVREGDVVP